MTNLILRNNLFEDLFDVRREFDKIFNRMLTASHRPREKWHPGLSSILCQRPRPTSTKTRRNILQGFFAGDQSEGSTDQPARESADHHRRAETREGDKEKQTISTKRFAYGSSKGRWDCPRA